MARNFIQFQRGLSLSEFQKRYGTEEQCEAAVRRWRWPDGFVCPRCGGREHTVTGKRRLHECHACRLQTSLKAGTIFAKSLLPLVKWFQAMFLVTQSKNSISSLELSRQLGVKYDSAWLMRQKLNAVMQADEAERKLDGRVEMDDAVLGGEKGELDGGKRGRGGPNKIPFVVAVATTDDGHPQRLALLPVAAHNSDEIERVAKAHLAPTARVVSDGLACFMAVTRAGLPARARYRRAHAYGTLGDLAVLSLGQYRARQLEDCNPRNLPCDPPALCAARAGRVPVALQPPCRHARNARQAPRCCGSARPETLPPAQALGDPWVIRHKCEQCTAIGILKRDCDERVRVLFLKFGRAPRLHNALAGHELEIAARNISVEGRHRVSNRVGHPRFASCHRGMRHAVEPGVVDLLRRGRNVGSEGEIVGHGHLLLEMREYGDEGGNVGPPGEGLSRNCDERPQYPVVLHAVQ